MRQRTSVKGFSLIELMIGVAVLAILITLAVPSFRDLFDRSRLKGAADSVTGLIATARGEAVKRGRNVTVSIGGTTAAWCVGANESATPAAATAIGASAACNCTTANACFVDGVRRVVSGADFGSPSISAVGGSFEIDGQLGNVVDLSPPAAVQLTSPRGLYVLEIRVTPLGHVHACVPGTNSPVSGFPAC